MIYIYKCPEHQRKVIETDVKGKYKCPECGESMAIEEIGVKFTIDEVTIQGKET